MKKKPPYSSRYWPEHPLAAPSGWVSAHRVVLYAKIGAGEHACHWCGRQVKWVVNTRKRSGALIADHLDGDNQNNKPDNLVPSCNRCNMLRDRAGMIGPAEPTVVRADGAAARATPMTCHECGQAFLIETSQLSFRQGRFCSRACRNKTVARESGVGIQEGELFLEVRAKERVKRVRAESIDCLQCGRSFLVEARLATVRRCCSRDCAARRRRRFP